jgi:hypothetical protein
MPSPLPSPRETALGSLDASGGAQGCVDEGPGRFLGNADPCRLYKLNVPRRGVATLGHNPASDLYPLGAGFPLIGHRSLRAEPAGANSVSTHPGSMRSMWSTQSP